MRHRVTIRQFRLWSGLVLFAYIASHFANHAVGLVSLDAMEAVRERIFDDLWRGILLPFLLVALLGHVALAFWAIYSRHSFKLLRWEWAQLLLGFAIPPLLAVHLIGTLGASFLYGIEPTYTYVLLATWVEGGPGLLQQIVVLFVARQVTVFTRVSARIGLLAAEHELWRTLMPAPPPTPAPVSVPAPAPPSPMDVIDAPI